MNSNKSPSPHFDHGLQLRTLITGEGQLEMSLHDVATPALAADEVLIRVEAAPINPSDIGLLFGAADMSTAVQSGSPERPVLRATVPPAFMKAMAGRLDESMPAGNEGAGTVIAAGESPDAQALLGKTVAAFGGAMYTQFRAVKVTQCLPLPAGTRAAQGASCFVNPLTSLGMVETMRLEGHKALVHAAAASNLGQMLHKICAKDGVPLVNIVRGDAQAKILRDLGAQFVCNSSAATFLDDLTDAIVATGATLAFDPIGGGKLAGQILGCMETAINRQAKVYSRYGSDTHKQVYIYGGLDTGPTQFNRGFGMSWGMGGWLLWPFLNRVGPVAAQTLRERVIAELNSTFASHYTREVSLAQALQLGEVAIYGKRATGEKYLVNPSL
jgi:NADPH:quinone reductase